MWRVLVVVISLAVSVSAQTTDKPTDLPDTPTPKQATAPAGPGMAAYLFLAQGALVAPAAVNGALTTGVGMDAYFLRLETGYVHQSGARGGNAGQFTVGFAGPRRDTIGPDLLPYGVLAYTRLFGGLSPGNALTVGAGIDWYYADAHAVRIEAQDMIQPGAPAGAQHTIQLRIGWLANLAD